jgi:adenine-specific DNA-methyltransferase
LNTAAILADPATPAGPARDVAVLGQVFTPPHIVEAMLALRRNTGRVLEPSCGNGAFSSLLPGCVAIEPDARHAPPGALVADFFAYPDDEKFETIIGNPPYVRFQDIRPETKVRLPRRGFDLRTNLYLFFIDKCLRHLPPGGELIFITPRDFLKTTSSVGLNRRLFELGTITDFIELGDARFFEGAIPNCAIWRFERGDFSRRTRFMDVPDLDSLGDALAAGRQEEREFVECAGHLLFTRRHYPLRFSDLFFVKVGAVSGDDAVFANEDYGNLDFVCSETCKTGKLRRMIYNQRVPYLEQFKERLMARRIRPFDESNWWLWGRGYFVSDQPRIYVNNKTRNPRPFFVHPNIHYDGAVLAVFPHDPKQDVDALCAALNDLDWADLGFVCDGRFLFTQRSLENAPLPETFAPFFADGPRHSAEMAFV